MNDIGFKDFFGGLSEKSLESRDPRPLRAVIRELNEYFTDTMTTCGNRRDLAPDISESLSDSANPRFQSYLSQWVPGKVTADDLMKQLMRQAANNRGTEFPGNANQMLVGELFRDQVVPWRQIAQHHLKQAWQSVDDFVQLAFGYLTDDSTKNALLTGTINPELEKFRDALDKKLDKLLS